MGAMLLAIDVGNTQSHVGVFDGQELIAHWRFATEADETADEIAVRISALAALGDLELGRVGGAVVSSVVPQLTPEYAGMCERYLDGELPDRRPRRQDRDGDQARQPAASWGPTGWSTRWRHSSGSAGRARWWTSAPRSPSTPSRGRGSTWEA